jgi:ABC-type protease/lipase transport system fused ATPase/permease subunit
MFHETPSERRRAAQACARQVLNTGNNRVTLVIAGIACAAVSFLSFFTVWSASLALYAMPIGEKLGEGSLASWLVMHLLVLVVFWLLAMPLWFGMYRMAIRMVDGDAVDGATFFHYVSSVGAYRRALRLSARMILRWLPAFVGFLVMLAFFSYDLIGVFLVVAFAITVLLSLLWIGKLGGLWTLALEDDRVMTKHAEKLAIRRSSGERMCNLGFGLDMAWRILLSLLFVGLPLMLHTLPMVMLSSACYAKRMVAGDGMDEF